MNVEIEGYETTYRFKLAVCDDGDVRVEAIGLCETGYWDPVNGLQLCDYLEAGSENGEGELSAACARLWLASREART